MTLGQLVMSHVNLSKCHKVTIITLIAAINAVI